jgi:hypothetical protein
MSRSTMLAAVAIALSANTEIFGHRPGDEWVPDVLPPIDPNFRIKKPAKSWGRKSKKKGRRS